MTTWIMQINCIQNSHLGTLQFGDNDTAYRVMAHFREVGFTRQEDDGSFENWPPHLLGCIQLYEGERIEDTTPYLIRLKNISVDYS